MAENYKDFFLIVPPGFEQVAAQELRYWLPEAEISEQSRGGIGFKSDLQAGYHLNRVLKVPARILIRLADFGCSDFPKLFKKTKSFPWSEWLPKNSKVQVEASTHQSRLKIKSRIESTVLDALAKNGFKPSKDEDAVSVYIRIIEDVCYMSLDTSGEILHKRGYREYTPDAPLRENLAAAILLTAKESFEATYEGKSQPVIIDPMAGSGTFLIEALNLYRKNQRGYAFEKFVNNEKLASSEKNSREKSSWVSGVFGIESDSKAILAAKKAFTNFGDKQSQFAIEQADVFSSPANLKSKLEEVKAADHKILVCNPPYGKRLKIEEPFSVYYPKLLNRFEELFAPQIASIILPQKVNLERLKLPPKWELLRTDSFSNGGFSVVLVTFKRSEE